MTDRTLQTSIAIMCAAMVTIVGSAWTARAINGMLAVESVEICHRDGGTATTCGELPR